MSAPLRAYVPCRGHALVCRRDGCPEPATDAVVQLCAGHLAAYQLQMAPVLAPKRPRGPHGQEALSRAALVAALERMGWSFEGPAWHALAACRGVGAEAFFPRAPSSPAAYEVAESYCTACPVRAECAQAGMAERFGMWGGVIPTARSRAQRAAPGPVAPEPLRAA
jgi:hypothetical protein